MPESMDLHKEVVKIKNEMKDMRTTLDTSLIINKEQYMKIVDECIGRSRERVKVFLAVNGKDSVNKIAKKLNMKPQNVTRALRHLKKYNMVYISESGRYVKAHWTKVLHIEEYLKNKFSDVGLENHEK